MRFGTAADLQELIGDYRRMVLQHAERLASLVDRRPGSPTYGCCHPAFWRAANAANPTGASANPRWQETGYSLALLHELNLPGNPLYHQEQALEWVRAILRYWATQQRDDGSFAAPDPGGRPDAITAPLTAAMAKTFHLILPFLTGEEKRLCLPAFKRAGEFLTTYENPGWQRHEAAAVEALAAIHRLLPRPPWILVAREKVTRLGERQGKEGWLAELDGPDLSAATEALLHLASYGELARDPQVEAIVERALDFIRYFIYPDGASGGGANTRHASGLAPGGLAALAERHPLARALLVFALRAHTDGHLDVFESDDYLLAILYYHYAAALYGLDALAGREAPAHQFIPADSPSSLRHGFPQARISIEKRSNYYAVCAVGGSLAAVYSYRAQRTLMLCSPVLFEAVSGLKAVADDRLYWVSMQRGEESRTRRENTLTSTRRVEPYDIRRQTGRELDALDEPPSSLLPRFVSRMLGRRREPKPDPLLTPLPPTRGATGEADVEIFECHRQLEFREGAIVVTNLVRQKTRDRVFQQAAICESFYFPPDREPERHTVRAGARTLSLRQLAEKTHLRADALEVRYDGAPVVRLILDGERELALHWRAPASPRRSFLRFLRGSCLIVEIDIRESLTANWKAQVNYTLDFEAGANAAEAALERKTTSF